MEKQILAGIILYLGMAFIVLPCLSENLDYKEAVRLSFFITLLMVAVGAIAFLFTWSLDVLFN